MTEATYRFEMFNLVDDYEIKNDGNYVYSINLLFINILHNFLKTKSILMQEIYFLSI